jgi:glyoxylase-like metal-dependent hydrolase (beta-lactamase superfamily II)
MTARRVELGDGVLVCRHVALDLSIGLVLGDGECLVVDTRGDLAQGAELAAAVREITPAPWPVAITHALPDRLVTDRAELTGGGRRVVLASFGPGHTDGDLVAHVPDAGVVFAGDLVEQGAPAAFEDSHPRLWPTAVDGILGLAPTVVSPGHGEPVDVDFVTAQRAEPALISELSSDVVAGSRSRREALVRSPYPDEVLGAAIERSRTTRPAAGK